MSKLEKYGFYLLKADGNKIDAIRQTSSEFTLEQLRTLTDSRCIEIVKAVNFNDNADFDSLLLVVDDEGAISGKKAFNEIASFMYGQPIFGDVVLCRGERRPNEVPDAYPFDLTVRTDRVNWDAVDFFRLSQILPAYAEFLYSLKDYPTEEDLRDIFGYPLQSDN